MEKASFSVKNATKKPKLPEIRQTLTSKYRLLKANPILLHEMEQKLSNAHELPNLNKSLKTIAVALDDKPKNIVPPRRITSKPRPPSFRPAGAPAKAKPSEHLTSNLKPKPSGPLNSNLKPKPSGPFKSNSKPKSLTTVDSGKKIDFISRNKQAIASKTEFKRPKPLAPKDVPKKPVVETKPIRRSLSAQHFDRVKHRSEKTKSAENLDNSYTAKPKVGVSPIIEEQSPELSFKTPMAYERRSIAKFKTPNTTNNRRSVTNNNSVDMHQRLNDWLKNRGKSLGEFHHLKCFGVKAKERKKTTEENKENVEELGSEEDRGSYEDLNIALQPEKEIDLNFVANEALVDLYKLILEGYPQQQCEAWLSMIRRKYKDVEKEPQYWECRAAIEQARGNITSAVEFYKTAIVQGADVKAVDESLDQLLRKFSLLDMNAKKNANANKDRNRIVTDARNVFKSSIIQFAVQEKALKKSTTESEVDGEKKMFIATPVRRSTRFTKSAYSKTPGTKIFCSLQEVDEPMKNNIDFHPNHAL